jgi:hypothetical protein
MRRWMIGWGCSRSTRKDCRAGFYRRKLLTPAALKGPELLTVPVANRDFWSWRPRLVLQVEGELGLGIWLLSGLFRP